MDRGYGYYPAPGDVADAARHPPMTVDGCAATGTRAVRLRTFPVPAGGRGE